MKNFLISVIMLCATPAFAGQVIVIPNKCHTPIVIVIPSQPRKITYYHVPRTPSYKNPRPSFETPSRPTSRPTSRPPVKHTLQPPSQRSRKYETGPTIYENPFCKDIQWK